MKTVLQPGEITQRKQNIITLYFAYTFLVFLEPEYIFSRAQLLSVAQRESRKKTREAKETWMVRWRWKESVTL